MRIIIQAGHVIHVEGTKNTYRILNVNFKIGSYMKVLVVDRRKL